MLRAARHRDRLEPRVPEAESSYENQPGVRIIGLCAHSSARGIQHQRVETTRSAVDQTGDPAIGREVEDVLVVGGTEELLEPVERDAARPFRLRRR